MQKIAEWLEKLVSPSYRCLSRRLLPAEDTGQQEQPAANAPAAFPAPARGLRRRRAIR